MSNVQYRKTRFKITQIFEVIIKTDNEQEYDNCLNSLNIDDLEIYGIEDELETSLEFLDFEVISAKPMNYVIDTSHYETSYYKDFE